MFTDRFPAYPPSRTFATRSFVRSLLATQVATNQKFSSENPINEIESRIINERATSQNPIHERAQDPVLVDSTRSGSCAVRLCFVVQKLWRECVAIDVEI